MFGCGEGLDGVDFDVIYPREQEKAANPEGILTYRPSVRHKNAGYCSVSSYQCSAMNVFMDSVCVTLKMSSTCYTGFIAG